MKEQIKNLFRYNPQYNNVQDLNIIKYQQQILINQGCVLSRLNLCDEKAILDDIQKAEFKVFSQWGDDGIIDFLVNYLEIEVKSFVEFGVENYTECNTKFLLVNKNWKGLIMDGSFDHMESVRNSDLYWKYDLKAIDIFINQENINELLVTNGFEGEIGLLHIDIDGNDYWVWKNINIVNPIIVIVEYNSAFGVNEKWTIPYDPLFFRTKAHYSNLYYGASLAALFELASEKGYSFVGCNSNGNNAYFVRNDKIRDLKVLTVKEGFVDSKFSESRDEDGRLIYLRSKNRLEFMKGKPIFDLNKNEIILL